MPRTLAALSFCVAVWASPAHAVDDKRLRRSTENVARPKSVPEPRRHDFRPSDENQRREPGAAADLCSSAVKPETAEKLLERQSKFRPGHFCFRRVKTIYSAGLIEEELTL